MTKVDPKAKARVTKYYNSQLARGQRLCTAWVDRVEFERGYAMYDCTEPSILLEAMNSSADQAALVLGWRKAMNEHLEKLGTRNITQTKLDYKLSQIRTLGPDSVVVRLDLLGNLAVAGPATVKQLSALARLSEKLRKNGQSKN